MGVRYFVSQVELTGVLYVVCSKGNSGPVFHVPDFFRFRQEPDNCPEVMGSEKEDSHLKCLRPIRRGKEVDLKRTLIVRTYFKTKN